MFCYVIINFSSLKKGFRPGLGFPGFVLGCDTGFGFSVGGALPEWSEFGSMFKVFRVSVSSGAWTWFVHVGVCSPEDVGPPDGTCFLFPSRRGERHPAPTCWIENPGCH